jgi:hypothetical protein
MYLKPRFELGSGCDVPENRPLNVRGKDGAQLLMCPAKALKLAFHGRETHGVNIEELLHQFFAKTILNVRI